MIINNDLLDILLGSIFEGILIADSEHIVKYVNPSYERITGIESESIIGKHLEDVRPGARLPYVIDNGEELLNVPRMENGLEYMVNMVPIKQDDKIIGGISIVNEMDNLYDLFEKLKKSESIIKKLEDHVNKINQSRYDFEDIISLDDNSLKTKELAKRAANSDSNILITGETGTGKELYAHSIHSNSDRSDNSFIAINSASFDKNLLESELFGYEEGAFTGAKKNGKFGLFEIAHGGTLFLDEIGEMDLNLQSRLLRVLQEGRIRRIGGLEEIAVDVRIIAATNKDLLKMCEDGEFRKDLYYRLSVFPINVLPLRERQDDIEGLINLFLKEFEDKFKRSMKIEKTAMNILINYDWPGNVRELKNAIEFSANMTDDYWIKENNLPQIIRMKGIKDNLIKIQSLSDIVLQAEKEAIENAILIYGNSVEGKKIAAKALNISLSTLYNKIKEHDF